MKKTLTRQRSINSNFNNINISLKDPKIFIKKNNIKSRDVISQKNSTKNNSIKNNKKINDCIIDNKVYIKNESSYKVLESFLSEHQIKYTSIFILYLSEIWRELCLYSTDYNKGIIPFAFSRFFPLQGLIGKRLFDVLDINKDGYLSPKEFIQGLSIIFCEDICSLIEFIFLFYDFDFDGYITREDIHAIMTYIPVINSFDEMIDVEEEIQNTLEQIFVDEKNKINLIEFIDLIINQERYEIFIPIISFFFEQKPFSNQQIYFFYKDILNNNLYNTNEVKGDINCYKIDGKIKLKIEKDNENKNDDKIIFAFEKKNYNDIIDITNVTNENYTENTMIIKDNKNISLKINNVINDNNNIKNNNNNEDKSINDDKNITNENIENNIKIIENDNETEENNNILNNLIFNENDNIEKENEINNSITQKTEKEKNKSLEINLNNNILLSNQSSSSTKNIKNKALSHFISYEKKENLNENNINVDNFKYIEEKENRIISTRNRTRSMRNIKYRKENLKDLVSKSKGFKHLQNSIPSLINNTKILSRYSSKNLKINDDEGQNKYKKGNLIKDLCKSKINYDNSVNERQLTEDNYEIERNEYNEFVDIKVLNTNQKEENEKNNKNLNKNEIQNNKDISYESYLYKITPNTKKLKKLYFKLFNKDLYYYKNDKSPIHKGMHNLCHYFLELTIDNENESEESSNIMEKNNSSKENDSYINSDESDSEKIIKKINSIDYYCFILISQKGKIQWYLTPDIDIYNKWIENLKKVLDYKDITDKYEFKEVIGNGKFSTVYCAYDKTNKRKVAIKRIDKSKLKLSELELVKTEIDTLKICQHPYVITLYDVIENVHTMDIVIEYCKIGNLYNYLSKKKFNLTEQQIVKYIHKIAKAVYSMHNLGIIHRDLKLSNIAIANGNEDDIRIIDFGLSEIIGPGETCCESYGTPGYAAPEVINEENYRFKADVWSIGAIAYFMCTSKLPFDYPTKGLNKNNIILNTLNDELKFNEDCWKKYSKEAIKFIKDCMNKDSEKRLNIKQVLEHEWIKKYFYKEVKNRQSSNNIINFKKNIDSRNIKKTERQKSYQKKISSIGKNYRLYVSISDE